MEKLTNKETAQAAKDAGFDGECSHYYYTNNGKDWVYIQSEPENYNDGIGHISRPTLHQLNDWLRNVKGLHVCVDTTLDWSKWYVTISSKSEKQWSKIGVCCDTHDQALEAGIKHGLKIVKDGNKLIV